MLGIFYLFIALACWTVWAILSSNLSYRLAPLNCLLWTGLVNAVIIAGGFVTHHRQLRLPAGSDWWIVAIFCIATTFASLAYYAALRHLPSTIVLPISHLYLVFGPVLIALLERQSLTWAQVCALGVVILGVLLFLAVSPAGSRSSAGKRMEPVRPGSIRFEPEADVGETTGRVIKKEATT